MRYTKTKQDIKIGDTVRKFSDKPFKNGERTDIVSEIKPNPQSPTNAMAAYLENSETFVNLQQLMIVL